MTLPLFLVATKTRCRPGLAGLALLAGTLAAVIPPAAAQSCTTIGASTFCGARGAHNTVGNTVIFNTGPAGQGGAESRGLVGPRGFTGVGRAKPLGGAFYEARIAALRAEILALEARHQLEQMALTPAQEAAKNTMPPALVRALTLARKAREKAAADGTAE